MMVSPAEPVSDSVSEVKISPRLHIFYNDWFYSARGVTDSTEYLKLSKQKLIFSNIAGPEYGTTEAAWKAVLNEADRRCDLHLRVKENLNNEVITSIKNWQKDNFHKQVVKW